MKLSAVAIGIALSSGAGATCPMSECNYLDPQFQASFKTYNECATAYTNRIIHAFEALAVMYPRFGIAYRAYSDDVKSAIHSDGTSDQAVIDNAKIRFDDRILHTAETEALQQYNMILLSSKQRPVEAVCGVMPEPPKKLP
jgi:hypothetical protein